MNIQKAQKMLQVLIGLPLRITRLAADMRGFHFGQIQPNRKGNSGEYVLHLSCSWRIEKDDELLTGHRDLWNPKDEDDWDTDWDHEENDNLQNWKIEQLMGERDVDRSFYNHADNKLIVESVEIFQPFGDLSIQLSGGFKIVTFVNHSRRQSWFFFRPGLDTSVNMEISEGKPQLDLHP